MAKFFGLDKVARIFQIIKFNGGLRASIYKYYRNDDLKIGELIGTDKYGNRYYQNKMYFYGRNRWVEYADHVNMDYDGSQIPAEWHRWMHYITDDPPNKVVPVHHKWMIDHKENLSGTSQAYMPYSTTKPKIQAWVPPKK